LKSQGRPKATVHKTADLQEKRNILQRRIEKWRDIQAFYMPAISELCLATESEGKINPENTPLYLPSGFPSHLQLPPNLVQKEKRIRLAQAEDALAELQRLLQVTLGLWDYKFTQLGPSQRAGTRAQSMISRFNDKISHCADRYRAARAALLRLDPGGSWMERLLELKAEHVRTPRRNQDDESEGRREVSWIWMVKSHLPSLLEPVSEEEIGDSKCAHLYIVKVKF